MSYTVWHSPLSGGITTVKPETAADYEPIQVEEELFHMVAKLDEMQATKRSAEKIYKTIFDAPLEFNPPPESILSEAKRLVEGGERNQSYGPPEMDFKRIADMVTALLRHKLKDGEILLPEDIARMMICLKLSRSVWQQKRDNWVDMAGYAACGHRCETGEW